jgi:hypothetical protein
MKQFSQMLEKCYTYWLNLNPRYVDTNQTLLVNSEPGI